MRSLSPGDAQGPGTRNGISFLINSRPRVPSGGVTLKRRCTFRPSVIYLIVNELLSLSLSLSLFLSVSLSLSLYRSRLSLGSDLNHW